MNIPTKFPHQFCAFPEAPLVLSYFDEKIGGFFGYLRTQSVFNHRSPLEFFRLKYRIARGRSISHLFFNCSRLLILVFLPFYYCYLQRMVTVPLPSRLFSLYLIKKGSHHLRAWRRIHHFQFTVGQVVVQHLVVGMTYTLLIMPIRILIPTLILAPLTLFQMKLPTVLQSWLEPVTFHLTRLRYFISLEFC